VWKISLGKRIFIYDDWNKFHFLDQCNQSASSGPRFKHGLFQTWRWNFTAQPCNAICCCGLVHNKENELKLLPYLQCSEQHHVHRNMSLTERLFFQSRSASVTGRHNTLDHFVSMTKQKTDPVDTQWTPALWKKQKKQCRQVLSCYPMKDPAGDMQ
jgi:hypothetical protein